MKKLKYIGILFLLILFSCVDDESRYGDIDIDEIKIEGIKDYQEIEVGGKLTITPVVTTKFGEKSDLSYVWYKYNEEQSVADTLSFEKNLDVVISDVLPGQTALERSADLAFHEDHQDRHHYVHQQDAEPDDHAFDENRQSERHERSEQFMYPTCYYAEIKHIDLFYLIC